MGLTPEDMKQMQSMWKNMDDLAESDPEQYQKFTADVLAEGPPTAGGKARTFVPTPSFVVKVLTLDDDGLKMFVNMTSCPALEPPKDRTGRPMAEGERHSADGLDIPLLVGEVRRCADHTGDLAAASAVDVVFHPWITFRCDEDNTFKAQLIELALSWVEQETHLKFEKRWKTIKSKYKGGMGDEEDLPMPFPVDRALEQDGPIEGRKPREPEEVKGGEAPRVGLSTPSPESLLRAAAGAQESDGASSFRGDIKLPGCNQGTALADSSSSSNKPRRPLIEEVTPPTAKSAPKVVPKAAVKKGFLHAKPGKKAPLLYDDSGSSGDGAKEVRGGRGFIVPLSHRDGASSRLWSIISMKLLPSKGDG